MNKTMTIGAYQTNTIRGNPNLRCRNGGWFQYPQANYVGIVESCNKNCRTISAFKLETVWETMYPLKDCRPSPGTFRNPECSVIAPGEDPHTIMVDDHLYVTRWDAP